jgi:hypothetical protein
MTPGQLEPAIKNPKLTVVLKAAHRDKQSSKAKLAEMEGKSLAAHTAALLESQLQTISDPNVRQYSFTESLLMKVQLVAVSGARKCGLTTTPDEADDGPVAGSRMTITYTYGYSYMRRDYTSILVVSIVVIFMLAIILVELLDKVIDT